MSNKRYIKNVFLIVLLLSGITATVFASKINYDDIIVTLSVRGADIKDVLLMLTEQSGINLVPDETVTGQVTIDLKDVEIMEALRTLTIAYGYNFNMIADNIFLVSREGYRPPAEIKYEDNLLTLRVENGDVREVLNQIAELAGINIIMNDKIHGMVSANLRRVPLETGLSHLLQANGFSFSRSDDIYRIYMAGKYDGSELAISVSDGLVSIDVRQADLAEVLYTISRLADINIVLFGGIRDVVDLKIDDVPVEEAIDIILSGTRFSYAISNGVYLVGDKSSTISSTIITTNKLIPLEYLEVEKVPQLLPHNFPPANIKVFTEKNSLLVTGTPSEIEYIEDFIKKIDIKIPLIVVDALILELNKRDEKDPKLELEISDKEGNSILNSIFGSFSYKSVMELPADFYIRINNLVKNDLATIKARPNITVLNGQQASIDVGTVHYYKVVRRDSEGREEVTYDSVTGGISLQVTPWVSSSGEITLKLKPTVSNIELVPAEGPPPVTRRTVDTTIRVKDGQTIVIGGLIHDYGSNNKQKVPVLSDLPILGDLFKSNYQELRQKELLIYITPYVLNLDGETFREEMYTKEKEYEGLIQEIN